MPMARIYVRTCVCKLGYMRGAGHRHLVSQRPLSRLMQECQLNL